MLRAFWTWDPVSSGAYRAFDEPHAYANNKWFFDKSVWQKMFRSMNGCGFDAMILANTHPFPFMIDLSRYPDAKVTDDATAGDYQEMHHWVFETALDYDIAPYLLFRSIYYPEPMLEARSISAKDISTSTDLALEYTHYCTRTLLETYPELTGIFADTAETAPDRREQFIQQAIIDAVDAARPDAALYLCGSGEDPRSFIDKISRRGSREILYSIKYTGDYLVDSNPDPAFAEWVDEAGAQNVFAEFHIRNFEPWTSFSHDTVEGIVSNIQELGCGGFSLQPLSIHEWPHTSDTFFKYQWQRDLIWYNIWGGTGVEQLLRQGQPKWLLRNSRLIPGFQAGSRILELLALYFAGDKLGSWRPQLCSWREADCSYLLTIEDMLHLDDIPAFSATDWWEEITGDPVVQIEEYLKSGTPEDSYGPDELIEELADLSNQAIEAGEKGMRSASGEKEIPGLSRDALSMGRLGEFYVERIRAAMSHGRGDNEEALEHMTRALGLYREIRAVDSSHRAQFRISTGSSAAEATWLSTLKALESEHTDAAKGQFKRGREYAVD